jgi:hypothetical protein
MSIQDFDSREFVIRSPEDQPGLSAVIERGSVPQEYLNRYRADHYVRCAFCVGHTPHMRGFTVQMKDGRKALCGIDCARDFFGDEVAARFEEQLQRQINQVSLQRVVQRTVDGAPTALLVLADEWIPVEKAYNDAIDGLMSWIDALDLNRDLDGELIVLKKHRVVMVDTVSRDGRESQRKQIVEEVDVRVLGASCLLSERKQLAVAGGGLRVLANWAERPGQIKGKVADDLASRRRRILDVLNEGIAFVQSAYTFFTPENLAQFDRWYRKTYRNCNLQMTLSNSQMNRAGFVGGSNS